MSSAWETPLEKPHPGPTKAPPTQVGAWGTDAQEAEVEATSVAREAVARLESQLRRANAVYDDERPAPTTTGSIPVVAEELGAGPAPSIWPRAHRPPLLDQSIETTGVAEAGDDADDADDEAGDEAPTADTAAADVPEDADADPPDPAADPGDQIWPTGWWGENEDR